MAAGGGAVIIADLSSNNSTPDFAAMRDAGVVGVWLKVSEGSTWSDPAYSAFERAAHRAGLKVGGYHYARPDTGDGTVADALAEASWFLSRLRLRRGDLLPVLDFEEGKAAHLGPARLQTWAARFLKDVGLKVGAVPVFYSYPSYIADTLAGAPALRSWPLWLASYGSNDGARHPYRAPAGFRVVAHQYTSNGRVAGYRGRLDLSATVGKSLRSLTYQG